MWRAMLVSLPIAWLLAFGGLIIGPLIELLMPPAIAEYLFFSSIGTGWQPDYGYFQHGSSLVLRQRQGNTGWRDVQITPVTSLFQWAVSLPDEEPGKATARTPGYIGWTAVQKDWDAFVRTPAEQQRLEANQPDNARYYPRYRAARRREDSLARLERCR